MAVKTLNLGAVRKGKFVRAVRFHGYAHPIRAFKMVITEVGSLRTEEVAEMMAIEVEVTTVMVEVEAVAIEVVVVVALQPGMVVCGGSRSQGGSGGSDGNELD
ncbi:unnamed protein product [Linum trigynum]|uniref:Uncharacterized protein n=1 Tax=Linum trigynum TaxID=586398 RepID=A0AAV2E8G7_9ROSI